MRWLSIKRVLVSAWIAPVALAAGGDPFAEPTPLELDVPEVVDLAGATLDASEPAGFTRTLGWTRWWLVRSPGKGRIVVGVDRGSDLLPAMLAFRRSSGESPFLLGNNVLVEPCPGPFAGPRHREFAVDAESGDELVLGADVPVEGLIPSRFGPNGPEPDYSGPTRFSFRVRFHPAPANDRFLEPQTLAANFSALEANLLSASREPGEPTVAGSLGRTVWYQWTAPSNGQLSIGPTPRRVSVQPSFSVGVPPWSATGTLIPVWGLLQEPFWLPVGYAGGGILGSFGVNNTTGGGGGGITNPVEVNCTPIPSSLVVPVVPAVGIFAGQTLDGLILIAHGPDVSCPVSAGVTYRISMDATAGELGTARLDAAFTPAPGNDDVENAIPVVGTALDLKGHSVGTTRQALDAESAGSTWWEWTAEAEGPVHLSARSPDAANVQLELRVAASEGPPRALGAGRNTLSFYAARGGRYWVGISPVESQGDYEASLRQLPSRLRPVVVHSATPVSGLILGEAGWQRALLQQAQGGSWIDRGIVATRSSGTDAGVAGYLIPVQVSNLDPSAAGLFRVWLLDFDLPAPALSMVEGPVGDDSLRTARLELRASPGRWFEIESSTNLADWTSASVGLWSSGVSQFTLAQPGADDFRFFRAREPVASAIPLRIGN